VLLAVCSISADFNIQFTSNLGNYAETLEHCQASGKTEAPRCKDSTVSKSYSEKAI
jgi:hypothetical protein